MAQKRRKRSSRKTASNSFWVFLAIIIVLAIISMLISYFWVGMDKPDVFLLPSTDDKEEVVRETPESKVAPNPIEGTWVSNYDGAMLTISGDSFSLEIPGVDEGGAARGSLTMEGNICTFVYESGSASCKGVEGHYLYSIQDNGEIFFELIKDICGSRKERMSATWFKL